MIEQEHLQHATEINRTLIFHALRSKLPAIFIFFLLFLITHNVYA